MMSVQKIEKLVKTRKFLVCGCVYITMSPFRFNGGNQDIITFVFDAGIAFMSCGADGTSSLVRQKKGFD